MLGQPMFLPQPLVVGVRVTRRAPGRDDGDRPGPDAHPDAPRARRGRTVRRVLRRRAARRSTVADRATLSNMCPEYGATSAYFPVDDETLRYLRLTGRGDRVDLVERYTKEQGLFRRDGDPEPTFTEIVELDLAAIEPSVAGPKRPQDRVVALATCGVRSSRRSATGSSPTPRRPRSAGSSRRAGTPRSGSTSTRPSSRVRRSRWRSTDGAVRHGSVVIAAITSCTNTSNPAVMLAAGLLAKKAVEAGLDTKPWVKTSLAPGSRVVTDYLDARRAHAVPRQARVLARGVRVHDVHRELRAAAGGGGGRRDRERPRRGRRALGQPQLRGPDPSAGPGELPRVAAARGRVRPRGPRRGRPVDRTARDVGGRDAGVPAGPVAHARGGPRGDRGVGLTRTVRARVRADLRRRRPLARPPHARGSGLRVGSELDLRARAAVLRGPRTDRRPNPPTSPARAASSRSGTRSRPITSRRRARSSRTRPPGGTCSTTASSSATSTRTARGEATTR